MEDLFSTFAALNIEDDRFSQLQKVTTSTIYPDIQKHDHSRRSLAQLPLEIILRIIDVIFEDAQIIPIEISGPDHHERSVKNMATSMDYFMSTGSPASPATVHFLRHLNPGFKSLMVLFQVKGLTNIGGGIKRYPELLAIEDETGISGGVPKRRKTWGVVKEEILRYMQATQAQYRPVSEAQRKLWERTWRLCPLPEVTGWFVDEMALNDPESTSWNLVKRDES
ncbi:hypothetical protein N0V88_004855 [Collariella sp. IMI 366227]|nr:hypothetical protein N0V88_004855 [Collariella sp. IMI 366227]